MAAVEIPPLRSVTSSENTQDSRSSNISHSVKAQPIALKIGSGDLSPCAGNGAGFQGLTVMAKPPDPTKDAKFQGVVQHFLKTPPKPHAPKAKPKVSPRRPATKAETAALKRADKMVVKRMPKR